MSVDAYKNLALGRIAMAPSPPLSGSSLTLATGHAARLPAPPFNATVWDGTTLPTPANAEIVRVTALAGALATIERAQEGTTARAILAGDLLAATFTEKFVADLLAEIAAIPDPPVLTQTFLTATAEPTLANARRLLAGTNVTFDAATAGALTIHATGGGGSAAHHATHETGGSDALTALSASILTSGTLPDARLSANVQMKPVAQSDVTSLVSDLALKAPLASPALTGLPTAPTASVGTNTTQLATTAFVLANAGSVGANVAYKNIDNQFVPQTLAGNTLIQGANSPLYWRDTIGAADATMFQMAQAAGVFYIRPLNDALAVQNNGLKVLRDGSIEIGNALYAGGVVFPGRVDAPGGAQTSWYLGSHGSYGLYANTGIYLAGSVTTVGGVGCNFLAVTGATVGVGAAGGVQCTHLEAAPYHIRAGSGVYAGTGFYEKGRAAQVGHWTSYTPTVSVGSGSVTLDALYTMKYSLSGTTMRLSYYLVVTLAPSFTHLTISLPAGYTCGAGYANGGPWSAGGGGGGYGGSVTHCDPGASVVTLYWNAGFIGSVGGGQWTVTGTAVFEIA